ncbi:MULTISPECIES: amino acid ABC transporter permease [unclassified Sinorhizobium]|uniref:amino acid ABC transporter permease n=1 Tax=unclassified Sinorhizobium TaxID=2613772 RepID=UPI0024C23FFD|nr:MULTISPECIES: amino acid ABC transporter permease [unclassified Sinorhizobium]MDK1377335.1 amino acid ABC transporter permease [Sinorhizobium sp. 6-70]MDK1480345.1 amino acid ABC transporter permease [Sinorhizobium sp. 6-117]
MYDFNFAPVLAAFDQLAIGAWLTVRLSCAAMLIGLVVSIFCAWGKTSGPKILRAVIDGYIEIIRNTPFLVQIFFIYFGMPSLGLRLSPNSAALLALVVNFGAYGTEIIRAGIESIHKGQVEAGWALGLKRAQIFRYIIMKPALRTVYPALTSQFIYLMLNTSVVSVISADDLTAAGNDLQSATFASFEVYITVTLIYLALSVGFSALFYAIEKMAFKYPLSR